MTAPHSGARPQPTGPVFDARPLIDPVDPHAVAAFGREMRAKHPTPTWTVVVWVILAAVMAIFVLPMLVGIVLIVGSVFSDAGHVSAAAILPAIVIVAVIVVGAVVGIASWRRAREQRYRIARFAQANGMAYEDRVVEPALPGMIFQHGSGRMSSSLVRGHHPRFVEFGNYQYTVKHGKSSTTYRWGYVAVKLDVPLPNIVLDAVGNNGLGSNLPTSFSKDQRLSLEGDFDRYFQLYCPQGYEQDALYLFTPDIMARFIDHAAELDVEIVDDWMFLYMQRPVSTTDPATWAWLFGAVGALMTKFDQWARWRDDRLREALAAQQAQPAQPAQQAQQADPTQLSAQAGPPASVPSAAPTTALPFAPPAGMLTPPPPGVAPEGRRLKKSTPWFAILVFALTVIGWLWMQFQR
ncbi:hypothetical protein [Microbacterium sp.]|uniref:hypothetical protein n=1 Tax=Microbacterium sp. TaxID=51671 RepID=UPI002811CF7F|nr:hypothetical protein [Microbacterium sp.]